MHRGRCQESRTKPDTKRGAEVWYGQYSWKGDATLRGRVEGNCTYPFCMRNRPSLGGNSIATDGLGWLCHDRRRQFAEFRQCKFQHFFAEIDDSGNLKGLAPGKTTVTVSADNGVKGSVEVTVTLQGGNEEYGYEELN